MKQNQRKVNGGRRSRKQARARRKRRAGILAAVALLAFCALAAVVAVDALSRGGSRVKAVSAQTMERPEQAQAAVPAPAITFEPQATAVPTPEPTPTPVPTPEPTPEPTAEPTPFAYLPVVHHADIERNKIAVTVDDCYQVDNLKTIVSVAEENGAKLTLFPVGENLSKSGMADLLQRCAFKLGYEIENHTWSHSRIFRLPDEEMAAEIWKQDAALDKALGANYQAHFLRLMGGDGDTDPRIHSYLSKLGYLGIANWSVSGSDSDMKHIKAALAPGQIYLFHTTDPDTKKLQTFIPWAVSQGYELVTLNELFNLPANETSRLTDAAMPQPDADVDDGHTITEGEYTWVTARLQDKLRQLGYLDLDGPSTGYYGEQTAKAVRAFQKANGLPETGEADLATQDRILGS